MRASAGFMGQQWDTGETAFDPAFWAEVLRVLKPGGHVAAFSGTRTYHRMAVAIEDAGFEIRDQLAWTYGSGFPKSHDVSKGIDKKLGCERTKVRIDAASVRNPKATGAGRDGTEGASRPFIESAMERGFHEAVSDEAVSDEAVSDEAVAGRAGARRSSRPGSRSALAASHWTARSRQTSSNMVPAPSISTAPRPARRVGARHRPASVDRRKPGDGRPELWPVETGEITLGRWPANILLDGSDEVVALFPDSAGQQGAVRGIRQS
jgi:hypothetical protein